MPLPYCGFSSWSAALSRFCINLGPFPLGLAISTSGALYFLLAGVRVAFALLCATIVPCYCNCIVITLKFSDETNEYAIISY